MENMRFGSYTNKDAHKEASVETNKKSFFKKALYALLIIFIIGIVTVVYLKPNSLKIFNVTNKNTPFSAIFLSNGQVYFGKVLSNNNNEMTVKDVFYLQANNNSGTGGFVLLKLSNELHGPEDTMFINKNHVLFYENLRQDSKVVESIKNFKN